MRKVFLTLSLLTGMTALTSFTTNSNSEIKMEKQSPLYAVTITTTCGITTDMLIGGSGSFDSIYDAAIFLEGVFCDD